jgi:hypothetical protein
LTIDTDKESFRWITTIASTGKKIMIATPERTSEGKEKERWKRKPRPVHPDVSPISDGLVSGVPGNLGRQQNLL